MFSQVLHAQVKLLSVEDPLDVSSYRFLATEQVSYAVLECTFTSVTSGATVSVSKTGIMLEKGLNVPLRGDWNDTITTVPQMLSTWYGTSFLPEYEYTLNMRLLRFGRTIYEESGVYHSPGSLVQMVETNDSSVLVHRGVIVDTLEVIQCQKRCDTLWLSPGDTMDVSVRMDSVLVRYKNYTIARPPLPEKRTVPKPSFARPRLDTASPSLIDFIPKKIKLLEWRPTSVTIQGFLADSALPYNGYAFPFFTGQVQGGFRVLGIPFQASFFTVNQGFQSAEHMLASPLTYFNVSFDPNALLNETKVETRDVRFRADVLQQEERLDRHRQQLQLSLDSLKQANMPVGDTSLPAPGLPSVPSDSLSMDVKPQYAWRDRLKARRMEQKLANADLQWERVHAFRQQIEGLEAGQSELSLSQVPESLQKSAFGQHPFIHRLDRLKVLSFGAVYPKRPAYGLGNNAYLELQGMTAELMLRKGLSYYVLYGKSRSLPMYSPTIWVLENGLTHTGRRHVASIVVSHERSNSFGALFRAEAQPATEIPLYGGGTSTTNYIADARYILAEEVEVGVQTLVNSASIRQPFGLLRYQEMLYAMATVRHVRGRVYAAYTPGTYYTELDRTWMPHSLRSGTEVSFPLFRNKLNLLAGYEWLQTPFASDSTAQGLSRQNRNHSFKFAANTNFAKWPNLSVSYTPFVGTNTTFDPQRGELLVMNAATSVFVSSVNYNAIRGNTRFTSLLSFQQISNSVSYQVQSDSVTHVAELQNMTGVVALVKRKYEAKAHASIRWKDGTVDKIMTVEYLRKLGKHLSLGGRVVAAKQNKTPYYSGMLLSAYKLNRTQLRCGTGAMHYPQSRSYLVAEVGVTYVLVK